MRWTSTFLAIAAAVGAHSACAQDFSAQFVVEVGGHAGASGTNATLLAVIYDDFPPSRDDDFPPAPRYDVRGQLPLAPFTIDVPAGRSVPVFRASGTIAVVVASGKGSSKGMYAVTAEFNATNDRIADSVELDPSVATGGYTSTWAETMQLDWKRQMLWALADGRGVGGFDLKTGKWSHLVDIKGGPKAGDWVTSAFNAAGGILTLMCVDATNASVVHAYEVNVTASPPTVTTYGVPAPGPESYSASWLKQDNLRQLSFDPLTGDAWFVRQTSSSFEGTSVQLWGLQLSLPQHGQVHFEGSFEGGGDGTTLCSPTSTAGCWTLADNAGSSMWYGMLDSSTETDGVAFVVSKFASGRAWKAGAAPTASCLVFNALNDGQGWQVGMSGCFLPTDRVVGVACASN